MSGQIEMADADRPAGSAAHTGHWAAGCRVVLALCGLLFLVLLCLQTDHARLKGMPLEAWRLVPLISCAGAAAIIGKPRLHPLIVVPLAGIAGAFGSLDQLAGPYGASVGILVGAIVVLFPYNGRVRTENRHAERE